MAGLPPSRLIDQGPERCDRPGIAADHRLADGHQRSDLLALS
jgi:hypothetical protein